MESFLQKLLLTKIHSAIIVITGLLLISRSSQAQKFLIPQFYTAQYAGSIGYVSIGAGYDLFKEQRGSLNLTYGFVPASKGGPLHIAAAKFAYRPVNIRIKDMLVIAPLNPGMFVSYHFGKNFALSWDNDQYPKGYYWWSTAVRLHLSASNEVQLNTSKLLPGLKIHKLCLYSEFNTNDLYTVSWFKNRKALSLPDILKIGYGIRVYL